MDFKSRPRSARAKGLHVYRQTTPEQTNKRKDANIKEPLHSGFPIDAKENLFVLVAVVHLIIGIIYFGKTGDPTMLSTLLPYVGAYAGLSKVTDSFSSRKKKFDS